MTREQAIEAAAKAIANKIHDGDDYGMRGEDAYSQRKKEFDEMATAALEAFERAGWI